MPKPTQLDLVPDVLDAASARLEIYEDIGEWGVSARGFRHELAQVKDGSVIDLRIHSRGGSVFEAFPIYSMLIQHDSRVEVLVEGVALSAASAIAMAGDHIRMNSTGLMMIHDPWADTRGNADRHAEAISLLNRLKPQIVDSYLRHTNLKAAELIESMSRNLGGGRWFTAAEALEAGLVHEVVEMAAPKNAVDISGFEGVPQGAAERFGQIDDDVDPVEALAAEVLKFSRGDQSHRNAEPTSAETLALIEECLKEAV